MKDKQVYDLSDRVRIINKSAAFYGETGVVTSLLREKFENNIGVNVDGDNLDPTPHYYNAHDLEHISDDAYIDE